MRDLTGLTFNLLTVLSQAENTRHGQMWNCVCICGKTTKVQSSHLTSKVRGVKSCGCLVKTHGKSRTRLYGVWHGMLTRCFNKNDHSYSKYGERGITACERWRKFENFYADMHEGYKKGLTIERIDNDGNYEPSNCRWATHLEQQSNKRNNVKYLGETATDASIRLGLNPAAVSYRILHGWPIEDAFTLSNQNKNRKK